jgi:tRNA-modifying protein YgfZ
MSMGETDPDRRVLRLTGAGSVDFLQGLVTNDLRPLARGPGIVWCALLTPQGKYLAEFFALRPLGGPEGTLLLDVPAAAADGLLRRLALYRLRAAVAIEATDLAVSRGLGPRPGDALADPRHPGLGWRRVGPAGQAGQTDWTALAVEHLVPQHGTDLIPEDTYILEMGFERLNGVDFRKGCYVGQEVTARMKHKTELRRGMARVRLEGPAGPGTEITAGGRTAGRIGTRAGDRALAWLRFDRTDQALLAEATRVEIEPPGDPAGIAAKD